MVNFVVVSHSKKLAKEAILLSKMMQHEEFLILNAAGLKDSDEFGSDASIIIDAIKKASSNKNDSVLVFCEIGSSLLNSQLAIEMLAIPNVKLVNAPLIEGLLIGVAANNKDINLEDLLKEIESVNQFQKV